MLLTGQVYDTSTKTGIPYASVQITDSSGTKFLGGVVADEDGLYLLDNSNLDGHPIYVTSSGYMPVMVNDDVYIQSGMIGLDRAGDLPVVYVTPHSNDKNDWFIYLLFGGGLWLLLATARKEKGIKGVTVPKLHENEWIDIAIKIGIPLGIFFLVIKPLLVKLNLLPDKSEQQQNQSDQQAQNQQQQLGVYNTADNHTYSANDMDTVAVSLRNATGSWWGYDWNAVAEGLTWLTGMTVSDARYFLGTFAKKNGFTLYRWYLDKFANAQILKSFSWDDVVWSPGWGGSGGQAAFDYSAFYNRVGITIDNANTFSWAEVVQKFIDYTYQLAGVAQQ